MRRIKNKYQKLLQAITIINNAAPNTPRVDFDVETPVLQ
jgi:hypothetical protein